MPNPDGHRATLVARHPGNRNAERHGVYGSGRALEPRAQELADAIMREPHTVAIDEPGAREIARLIVLLETIDAELERGGLTRKNGDARSLVDLRLRASRRLAEWLDRYGMTPLSRATWAKRLSGSNLADEIR